MEQQSDKQVGALRQVVAQVKRTKDADRRLAAVVAEARYQGATWAAIGRALGVTRQAAHERFK